MRKFSSYGPVNKNLHYYVPREELIQNARRQLIGDDVDEGGHYVTVWAPRQCGKIWVMNEAYRRLKTDDRFHVLKMGKLLTEGCEGIYLAKRRAGLAGISRGKRENRLDHALRGTAVRHGSEKFYRRRRFPGRFAPGRRIPANSGRSVIGLRPPHRSAAPPPSKSS